MILAVIVPVTASVVLEAVVLLVVEGAVLLPDVAEITLLARMTVAIVTSTVETETETDPAVQMTGDNSLLGSESAGLHTLGTVMSRMTVTVTVRKFAKMVQMAKIGKVIYDPVLHKGTMMNNVR